MIPPAESEVAGLLNKVEPVRIRQAFGSPYVAPLHRTEIVSVLSLRFELGERRAYHRFWKGMYETVIPKVTAAIKTKYWDVDARTLFTFIAEEFDGTWNCLEDDISIEWFVWEGSGDKNLSNDLWPARLTKVLEEKGVLGLSSCPRRKLIFPVLPFRLVHLLLNNIEGRARLDQEGLGRIRVAITHLSEFLLGALKRLAEADLKEVAEAAFEKDALRNASGFQESLHTFLTNLLSLTREGRLPHESIPLPAASHWEELKQRLSQTLDVADKLAATLECDPDDRPALHKNVKRGREHLATSLRRLESYMARKEAETAARRLLGQGTLSAFESFASYMEQGTRQRAWQKTNRYVLDRAAKLVERVRTATRPIAGAFAAMSGQDGGSVRRDRAGADDSRSEPSEVVVRIHRLGALLEQLCRVAEGAEEQVAGESTNDRQPGPLPVEAEHVHSTAVGLLDLLAAKGDRVGKLRERFRTRRPAVEKILDELQTVFSLGNGDYVKLAFVGGEEELIPLARRRQRLHEEEDD